MSLMSYSKCFPLSRALFHNFHFVSLNLRVYVLLPMQGICGTSVILTYYYRYIPTLCRYTDSTFLRPVFFWCICLQSNTSFHEFVLTLTVRICPQNLGMEIRNGTTDFRSAGRLYNYWGPVNLSFLWLLGRTEPRGSSSQQEKHLPFQS